MWQTRQSFDDLLPPRPNPPWRFTDDQVKLQLFSYRSWHGLSGVAPSASLSAPFLPAPLIISIALACHGTLRAKVPTTHCLSAMLVGQGCRAHSSAACVTGRTPQPFNLPYDATPSPSRCSLDLWNPVGRIMVDPWHDCPAGRCRLCPVMSWFTRVVPLTTPLFLPGSLPPSRVQPCSIHASSPLS